MKLIFTLFTILALNAAYVDLAIAQTEADPQELEQKISQLYSSINPEGLSQDVFRIAYLKYIKFSSEGKLGNKSLITVVDFNKPSSEDRLWIMDVNEGAPKLIKKSLVTHGEKSGYLMAENFSNEDGTHMSSLKFYITGEPYQSSKVGYALKLHGQDPGINSNIFPRGIVMHRAVYATYERAARGAIGRSWGCLGVPTQYNQMFVDLLRGKTLIYVHSDKNPGSSPTITSDMVTAAREVSSNSQSPQVPPMGEPVTYGNMSEFDQIRGQQTIGAQNGTNSVPLLGDDGDPSALGIADDQREVAPASENDAPDKVGMAELHGTAGFEHCQNLATEPWCSIVKKVKAGADPHQFFEASWNDVQSKMENSDNIEDWRAENMAKNNLGMIRECAALVHLTDKTDCEKDEKNQDDKHASQDKAIECQYKGAESQDYKHCVKTVQEYDDINEKTAVRYQEQKVEFSTLGAATADKLTAGDNKQIDASGAQQKLISGAADIAQERGQLANAKARYLQSALTKFPTRQSRLDHCKKEYSRHSNGGIKLYKAFVRQFNENPVVPALPDPCYNAMVRMGPKLIHNVKARNQIKKVIQKAGLVAQDYYDKEARLMANKGAARNIQDKQELDDVDLIDSTKFGFNCKPGDECDKKAKTKFESSKNGGVAGAEVGGSGSSQSYAALRKQLIQARRERERRSFKKLNSGIHEEELYVTMDRAITTPTKKNLKRVEPEVVEFGRYYDFKDRQGQVSTFAKGKIEPFLASNGVETRAMRNKYSNKISGKREVWMKKDGTLFEFDIHKKKENSLWDIITNRYRRVYNPEAGKIK